MKNFLTFLQLETLVLRTNRIQAHRVPSGIRKLLINTALMRIYGALDGANDPWYNRVTTLITAPDIEFLNSQDLITEINATTNQITRATGTFVLGSILAIAINDLSLIGPESGPTGDAMTGDAISQALVRITAAGETATFDILAGSIVSVTAEQVASAEFTIAVAVLRRLSALTSSLNFYVKDVLVAWDNEGEAGAKRVFNQIKDPTVFERLPENEAFTETYISWRQQGNVVLFNVGSQADAIGIVQVEYRAKPALYENNPNGMIDIPPEQNLTIISDVTASFLAYAKGDVATIGGAEALMQTQVSAQGADAQKHETEKGEVG